LGRIKSNGGSATKPYHEKRGAKVGEKEGKKVRTIRIKAKTVDAATKEAFAVLGGNEENTFIRIINEGRPALLGMIGGEDVEIEATLREGIENDAKQVLQEILDKMSFVALVDIKTEEGGHVLNVRGDDMGRIIGKDGNTLKAFEILVRSMLGRVYNERININIDAGEYREKRKQSLERLAKEVADEVEASGKEKALPQLEAADRRIIHMFLKESLSVSSFSQGEGRDRRLVIAPKTQ
jgi:spoIIIJ-associated protein